CCRGCGPPLRVPYTALFRSEAQRTAAEPRVSWERPWPRCPLRGRPIAAMAAPTEFRPPLAAGPQVFASNNTRRTVSRAASSEKRSEEHTSELQSRENLV